MKKRLRKKLHLGEFREDCFELNFEIDSVLDAWQVNALTDSFIELIESRNLQFGGGGMHNWSGIVQGPCRGSATAADRTKVLEWLGSQPDIVAASAGPLRDAYHGWQ